LTLWFNRRRKFKKFMSEQIDDRCEVLPIVHMALWVRKTKIMYKLTKTFNDQAGPRRIADNVRGKIDKFKQHVPILQTICNPGIRDRHWTRVNILLIKIRFSSLRYR
jgi:hypothetical protein